MSQTAKINPAKIIINSEFSKLTEDGEVLILKNNNNDKLVKLASIEYSLLCKYAENHSISETLNFAVSQEVDVSIEQIIQLVETAKDLNLLVLSDKKEKIQEKQPKNRKSNSIYALFFIQLSRHLASFFRFTKLDKIGVKPEFKGDFRFYKLFSINISNTFISRIIVKPYAITALIPIVFIVVFCFFKLFEIQNFDIFTSRTFGGILMTQITLNKFVIFFILLIGIITTSFFHEVAHYFAYKQMNGKTNEFGFAMMNYFLPVVYVSTNSVYLWDKKWKKILVSSAGILLDIFMIFCLYALIASHSLKSFPNLTFISFLMMLYLIFRTLINVNFLIPGTDGYFIFVDIFNLKNFYKTTFNSTKLIFRSLFRGNFQQIRIKNIVHFVYYISSLIFVFVTSLLLILSLLYPLISDFLIGLTI